MPDFTSSIDITITKNTLGAPRDSFSVPMIFGTSLNSGKPIEYFTTSDLEELASSLLGGVESIEYKKAQIMALQEPKVGRFAVSQINHSVITDFVGTITAGSISVSVNDVEYSTSFSTDLSTTLSNLASLIDGGVDYSASSGASTITITPNSGIYLKVVYDLSGVTGTLEESTTAGTLVDSIEDSLNEIREVSDSWYGVVTSLTYDVDDYVTIATWIEANKKFFYVKSNEGDIVSKSVDDDTTSLLAVLKNLGFERTFIIYHSYSETEHIDSAVVSKISSLNAGTYTIKFKSLKGVTADDLKTSEKKNITDKNGNLYEEFGGRNILREGTSANGEFADIVHFVDWLEFRINVEVSQVFLKNEKVPYTDEGIQAIANAIESPLKAGQNRGAISLTEYDEEGVQVGGYSITTPLSVNVSTTDKANRELNDVNFVAWLSGAIHKVKIDGIVRV